MRQQERCAAAAGVHAAGSGASTQPRHYLPPAHSPPYPAATLPLPAGTMSCIYVIGYVPEKGRKGKCQVSSLR